MCGRYAMNAETNELIEEFVAGGGRPEDWWRDFHWDPRVSIAPTNRAPVVREDPSRGLEVLRWGRPKPPTMGRGDIINARVEKLLGGFWRAWLTEGRCIVPMTGYFEWVQGDGGKDPYHLSTGRLLAAAGICKVVDVGGEPQRVFVIATTDGVDAAGEIHDRMPLFLDEGLWGDWLTPLPTSDAQGLLDAAAASAAAIGATLHPVRVSRRLNAVSRVDPFDRSLLDPVG